MVRVEVSELIKIEVNVGNQELLVKVGENRIIMPKYKKGQVWNRAKTSVMIQFEKETKKNAIYNGKITGGFEYWLWQKSKISKQSPKITMEEILTEARKGPEEFLNWNRQLKQPKTYIIRRQSIPTTSKNDKQWKFYVKIGKEKLYIASENGSKRLIRLDGDKTRLRTHSKWRYSIDYDYNGVITALNVKNIEYKHIKHDSGYFVSNITDIVVDKMNMLAKHTGSKNRFSVPIKKVKSQNK